MGVKALRRAARPLNSPFALRSHAFEELVEDWTTLSNTIGRLSERLEEEMYDIVGKEGDDDKRHRALNLKRALHNDRSIESIDSSFLCASTREDLAEYESARRALNRLVTRGEDAVHKNLKDALERLWKEDSFRAAVRHSSAVLYGRVQSDGGPVVSSNVELASSTTTSLYRYAAKFLAKANPLYLFSEIGFPEDPRWNDPQPDGVCAEPERCELVFNVSHLKRAADASCMASYPQDRRIAAQNHWVVDGEVIGLPTTERGRLSHVLKHPSSRALQCALRLASRAGGLHRDALAERIARDLEKKSIGEVEESIDLWVEEGLLCEFVACNPLSLSLPAPSKTDTSVRRSGELQHASSGSEAVQLVRRANQLHGAGVTEKQVSEAELQKDEAEDSPLFYVNTYASRAAVAEAAPVAGRVFKDLRALRNVFAATSIFGAERRAIRRTILDIGQPVPLPRLLLSLYETGSNIQEHFEFVLAEEKRRSRRRIRTLRRLGERSVGDAVAWADEQCSHVPPAGELPMCMNGPYDEVDKRFYLTNIWDRAERFTSRFLLRQGGPKANDDGRWDIPSAEQDTADVQIYDTLNNTMNLVKTRFSTGCGYAPQLSTLFEEWVYPSDIDACPEGDHIVYRDRRSKTALRLHFLGPALISDLPLEYKLLLANHVGTCRNPFNSFAPTVDPGKIEEQSPIRYGSVCLRRRRWVISPQALPLEDRDSTVKMSLRFYDWMQSKIGHGRHFYYRVLDEQTFGHKPRYLDARNPISIASFARDLRNSERDATVILEPMQPLPEHHVRNAESPVVAERMISV